MLKIIKFQSKSVFWKRVTREVYVKNFDVSHGNELRNLNNNLGISLYRLGRSTLVFSLLELLSLEMIQ